MSQAPEPGAKEPSVVYKQPSLWYSVIAEHQLRWSSLWYSVVAKHQLRRSQGLLSRQGHTGAQRRSQSWGRMTGVCSRTRLKAHWGGNCNETRQYAPSLVQKHE